MRVGRRDVAEDIVQEVFIRFFRSVNEGKRIKSHEAYLLQSISNACIDWLRKKRPPLTMLDEACDIADEEEEDITEEFRRVTRLLDGMPFNQAETVRLHCYDELRFSQIAELQGVSETTVKSRYHRAIWYIKDKLNPNKRHD